MGLSPFPSPPCPSLCVGRVSVLLNGKKQKARPKGVNLKVRWRAKFAMRYRCGESARRAILVWECRDLKRRTGYFFLFFPGGNCFELAAIQYQETVRPSERCKSQPWGTYKEARRDLQLVAMASLRRSALCLAVALAAPEAVQAFAPASLRAFGAAKAALPAVCVLPASSPSLAYCGAACAPCCDMLCVSAQDRTY